MSAHSARMNAELLGTASIGLPASGLENESSADPEYLTFAELAKWLRCSTRTLQRLLSTGDGPPVIRLSERRVIFPRSDARCWLASRTNGAVRADIPFRRRGRPPKLNKAERAAP
jgi:predicted DNA-binding transcriptional regulator AlpA